MITPEGRTKVLDFGLAVRMARADVEAVTKTQQALPHAGMLVGTLAYMAPEVLRGEAATARSDIWALGVLIYEMASGRLPFDGTTVTDVISAVVKDSPAALPAKAWAGLRTIAQRCLAKEPGQRYSHASAVQAALEAIQSGSADAQPQGEARLDRPAPSGQALTERTGGVPWIAVLPFRLRGGDEELQGLAEGLTEEIITGLSQFSYLSVLGADSTLQYQGRTADARTVGREVGARYVVEGSLRTSGASLRVSAQLLDASTGTNLWAERFDRKLGDTDIFALQDELTDRIVAMVADPYGVLVRALGERARARPTETLTADESVALFFGYNQRVSEDEHLRARMALEQAVVKYPRHADVLASLSLVHVDEYRHGYNLRPDALDRALDLARRAVEVDPVSQLGYLALAIAHYYRRDLSTFRSAAERAVSLNPRDTNTVAHLGILIAFSGDFDAGIPMVRRAMALNPHHPGWYHFGDFWNHYRREEYDQALVAAQKVNLPNHLWTHSAIAAASAQLGRQDAAEEALSEFLALAPDLANDASTDEIVAKMRREFGKWFFSKEGLALLDQFIEGLRKASLGHSETHDAAVESPHPSSAAVDPSSAPSIAVLPFANMSADPEQEYFCDGIAEEITSALARVDQLRVAGRTSAFSFKGKTGDLREIGRTLNVSAVLEGSVRRAGNRLRITAELVNVADGYHLWSERYDRQLEDIFAVQDEIALAVVDALKLTLLGEEKAAVLKHSTENPEAYQLCLKARHAWYRWTDEGFRTATTLFEQALEKDANYALAHFGLGDCLVAKAAIRETPDLPKVRTHLETALRLDPDLAAAHAVLGGIVEGIHEWNWPSAESRCRKALTLNPRSAHVHFVHGLVLAVRGHYEESFEKFRRAVELDPLNPFLNTGLLQNFVARRDWEGALRQTRATLDLAPDYWFAQCFAGQALAASGHLDEAIAVFEQSVAASDGVAYTIGLLGNALAKAGRRDEARRQLNTIHERATSPFVSPVGLALVHAGLDQHDEAFASLERALEVHEHWLAFFLSFCPTLDDLRPDSRFAELRRRIGL